MATARFIRMIEGWQGNARLYELSEPIENYDEVQFDYVIVSAAAVPYSGPETYIFGANEKGDVLDWGELDGSFRGDLDHSVALAQAGYDVIP